MKVRTPITLVLLAAATAGVIVPFAQATPLQSRVTQHSASQNRVDRRNAANYGPLDPAIAAAIRNHQVGAYGTLDPAIAAAIRSHSAAKASAFTSAVPSVPSVASNGFKWRDAGVGAGVAFASMLIALGVAVSIMSRRRGRLAGL